MITVLSGGTGTPKLLQGLKEIVDAEELCVIVNTLENNYFSGVYVAADIDTVLYTLSNQINDDTWYGIKDDTFITHERLKKLGYDEKLRIGDKDRALKIQKTQLLEKYSLKEAVEIQTKALSIKSKVLPMSNMQSEVTIKTDIGDLSFHDFLIKYKSEPEVYDIEYSKVEALDEVIDSIENSEHTIIGPSNPITSINPILSMEGVKEALKKTYVTAVSPFIGNEAFSGPAAKFMNAKNMSANCVGVAKFYSEFLNNYIINTNDEQYINNIREYVPQISAENIILKSIEDKINLSKKILQMD